MSRQRNMLYRAFVFGLALCLSYFATIGSKPTDPMCTFPNPVSDYCDLKGDVRIHGNSSTIHVVSDNTSVLTGNVLWSIKPYARKGNEGALKNVREWKIRLVRDRERIPQCTQTHNVPAIIFSLSGYVHNLFHDFTDILIPLFASSRQFGSKVHFLNTDYRPIWLSRFRAVLRKLSRYALVNIDMENEIHCYKNVLVGLQRDKALDLDSSKSDVTMKDFRLFIRSTYSLKRSKVAKLKKGSQKKPRLMIISRQKRRKWKKLNETMQLAQSLGFDVVVAEANRTSDVRQFARLVNSCDALMGIHGAGLANMVFLPDKAVVIQVIPLGALWAFAKETFEDPR